MFVLFFQAEDGIRDLTVTGVQTCALPISRVRCIPTDSTGSRGNEAVLEAVRGTSAATGAVPNAGTAALTVMMPLTAAVRGIHPVGAVSPLQPASVSATKAMTRVRIYERWRS